MHSSSPSRPGSSWQEVVFPNEGLRREFLDQVRLWNRVEGLPPIATEPLNDPLRLKLLQAERGHARILQLVAAYGGSIPS
jgi:hypothetical protein